jgi:hypothetical protein
MPDDDGMRLIKYIARIFTMWVITALALVIIARFFQIDYILNMSLQR